MKKELGIDDDTVQLWVADVRKWAEGKFAYFKIFIIEPCTLTTNYAKFQHCSAHCISMCLSTLLDLHC